MTMFKFCIRTTKGLVSSFHFKNEQEVSVWVSNDFFRLKEQHPKLEFEFFNLPNLKTGDYCYVYGEGDKMYQIVGIVQNSKFKYSYKLSPHTTEEIHKCYPVVAFLENKIKEYKEDIKIAIDEENWNYVDCLWNAVKDVKHEIETYKTL